jgi:hypothetical protein
MRSLFVCFAIAILLAGSGAVNPCVPGVSVVAS